MTTTLSFGEQYQADFSAWVKYEDTDFEVNIKYLSMMDAEKLVKSCEKYEFDPKTHQKVKAISDDLFKKRIADLIVDWKGLTKQVAQKRVALKAGTPDGEFDCNPANKDFVISQFSGFASFVLDSAKNLHEQQSKEVEEEIKN